LTFDAANDQWPSWTPDGTRIVFSSDRDGGGLFWKSADGSGEVERLVDRPETRSHAWVSENRLLFDQAPGDIGVFTIGADQVAEMLLDTDFVEGMPALSPDGTWLAYQSAESGQPEIYVRPFPNIDDGRWQVSTNSGFDPVWSPDGQHLFYIEAPPAGTPGRMVAVQVETDSAFRASAPSPVFDIQNFAFTGGGRRFDIAPDGERFLVRTFPDGGPAGEGGFTGMILVQNWFEELTARVPAP
jgi:Tol biopolymer transport system component